jgi:phage FluMu gp28-like protein
LNGAVEMRLYQEEIFMDQSTGIVVLHWARQIGKSYVLAAWCVVRLLTRPGRLVTVLSNSRENGAEFVQKCAEICRLTETKFQTADQSPGLDFQDMRYEVRIRIAGMVGRIKVLAANPRTARGFSGDLILDEFAFHEDSAAIWEAAEPILASHPDYLCRIASTGNGRHNMFHRIVAGRSEARIVDGCMVDGGVLPHGQGGELDDSESRMDDGEKAGDVSGGTAFPRGHHTAPETGVLPGASQGIDEAMPSRAMYVSSEGFVVSRVSRTMAHGMGVQIFDMRTRLPITPAEARAQALNPRAYDQNYECAFADENMTLLSHELISAAERDGVGLICDTDWPTSVLEWMGDRLGRRENGKTGRREDEVLAHGHHGEEEFKCAIAETEWGRFEPVMDEKLTGRLYVGFDVGRKSDLSVITVVERVGSQFLVRGILRMRNMRLPDQQLRLGEICGLRNFHRAAIDMTGLGLGLFEYAQKEYGISRIHGINFAETVPASRSIRRDGCKRERVRVTEAMATELLRLYEDRRIQHPREAQLREDLRKPERVTSPGGRVSIAATRDEAGHADHFWSLALAIEAAGKSGEGGAMQIIHREPKKLWL